MLPAGRNRHIAIHTNAAATTDNVAKLILVVRGEKVILDEHIAGLYGVSTRVLVQAVRRNPQRFPGDFMFQVTADELEHLRSQNVISSAAATWGGRRYRPYAFTEQGVAMLSGVLRSPRAVQVNIEVMRAFVQLRGLLGSHEQLAMKLDELENKYDHQFKVVFDALRALMDPPCVSDQRRIGFRQE